MTAASAAAAERKSKPTYDELLERGTLSYEELCDHSRQLVEQIDQRRWLVGDDACAVQKQYGQDTLADFARDVNMNKSTVAGWKRVCAFYPKNIRRNLFDDLPNLSYSHYKDALRLETVDAAIEWLEKCSLGCWSPDKAAHELTVKLGKKSDTSTTVPGTISSVFTYDGQGKLEITIGLDDIGAFKSGMSVNLKLSEL